MRGPLSFNGGALEGPGTERLDPNMGATGGVLLREIGGGAAREEMGGLKWVDKGAGGISEGGTIDLLSTRISSVCIDVEE